MLLKKSIVLSGVNSSDNKAVLTLERTVDGICGSLRLYNFKSEPDGILSLGVSCSGKVHKAGLTRKSVNFYTFLSSDISAIDTFSCAVINFKGGEASPILFGSTEGQFDCESTLASALSSLYKEQPKTISDIEDFADNNLPMYEDELEEEIKEEIECELSKSGCSSCKYREAFFNEAEANIMNEEKEVEPVLDETFNCDDKRKFFDEIKEEINGLFENYPEEEILKRIIPNSKWVKVEYDDSGEYYVVGIIYDNGELIYVAYGVPGVYQKDPPKELIGYPIWLPLDESKPEGFGYYITYQDAKTGEEIKAEII